MRDIVRLMLGGDGPGEDGGEGSAGIWDGRRRPRPTVADSRAWCATEPDGDAIRRLARTLGGGGRDRRRRAAGEGRGIGPF